MIFPDFCYCCSFFQCLPFWPVTESFNMYVKYEHSVVSSQHFPIKTPHNTVLRMQQGVSQPCSWTRSVETPAEISDIHLNHLMMKKMLEGYVLLLKKFAMT